LDVDEDDELVGGVGGAATNKMEKVEGDVERTKDLFLV